MSSIEQWWSAGERVPILLGGVERQIFIKRLGAGPLVTLLHGFPSCSHDWQAVAELLASRHELLLIDFLGFGASEKPRAHDYSLHEQADLVEAVWAREGLSETIVLAHDYAVSVTQELLARRLAGAPLVKLGAVQLLNGGVYPDLHRRQPAQTLLLDPEEGPKLGALMNEELFAQGLAPTFAPGFDARSATAEMWRSMSRADGQLNSHLLIRYITDRERHEARWVDALQRTKTPLGFLWGMLDPVSGGHMAPRIRERIPGARFIALEDVSHWPALEAPQRVAEAVLGAEQDPPR